MSRVVELVKECRLSMTALAVVAVNVVFQISAATVIYTEFEQRYYFYSFLLLSLMGWVLYFAWQSLVKENPYELPAFLAVTALLNFHGIYMLAAHNQYEGLSVATYIILSACELCYLVLVPMAFRKFSFAALRLVRRDNPRIMVAFQLHESFVSLLKLDLCLGAYIYCCFFYYVVVNWSSVTLGVCTTASLGMIVFLVWFLWGAIASDREHPAAFIICMLFLPVIVGIKLYFAIAVIISPGTDVDTFVLVQLCIFGECYVGIMDALVIVGMVVLGIMMERTFGAGVKDVRARMDRVGLWKTLL